MGWVAVGGKICWVGKWGLEGVSFASGLPI